MDKATQVLGTFGKILPLMSEQEVDRLLAFGEGLAFKVIQEKGVPVQPLAPPRNEARPSA